MAGCEFAGGPQIYDDEFVSPPAVVQVGHSFLLQSKDRTALRSRGKLDAGGAIEGGYLQFVAQRRLSEVHIYLADQVVSFPLESVVRSYVNENVEIAVWPTLIRCVSFTAQ